MTARLSLYEKAEQELYKLDRSVKGKFYDFCHRFRQNPDHPGLDLKPLKGDGRVYRAKIVLPRAPRQDRHRRCRPREVAGRRRPAP
jgi:hypothetical protein